MSGPGKRYHHKPSRYHIKNYPHVPPAVEWTAKRQKRRNEDPERMEEARLVCGGSGRPGGRKPKEWTPRNGTTKDPEWTVRGYYRDTDDYV